MPDDLRPRYRVLRPISYPDGRSFWLQVGTAYQNPDGTIDAYVDPIPLGHHVRFRPVRPGDRTEYVDRPDAPDTSGEFS